jgi:hypothetical protein
MSNDTARIIDGWTVTAYPSMGATFKVIATYPHPSGKGKLAIHVDKLTAEQVATFDPVARWGGPVAPRKMDPAIAEMLA